MIIPLTSLLLSLPTFHSNPAVDTCKKEKDTLTGRTIYLTADVYPECEGGEAMLMRRLYKGLKYPDSAITEDIQSRYEVAFVVETNGKISGERIIGANTKQIGQQILKVVKDCHWRPARCNGKKVALLYICSITIDFRNE